MSKGHGQRIRRGGEKLSAEEGDDGRESERDREVERWCSSSGGMEQTHSVLEAKAGDEDSGSGIFSLGGMGRASLTSYLRGVGSNASPVPPF